MRISDAGLALIKEFEGLRLVAYRDSIGIPTIGYGHTGHDVKLGMAITEDRADQLLRTDVTVAEAAIERQVRVPLKQNQFDALCSFVFNLGAGKLQRSTLLRELNQGHYLNAAAEFPRWSMAGGVQLAGLLRRRTAERELFLQ